ncbi:MAG: hypothetical protein OXF02_02160 [Simkaniaceae bacterium]|nr:hypothetical protein [Simkaniaceae bacterium]
MTSAAEELASYPRQYCSALSRLQPVRRNEVIRKVILAQRTVWASVLTLTPLAGGICALGRLLFRSSRFPSVKTGILIGFFLALITGMLKSQSDLAVAAREAENRFRHFYNRRLDTNPPVTPCPETETPSMRDRFLNLTNRL